MSQVAGNFPFQFGFDRSSADQRREVLAALAAMPGVVVTPLFPTETNPKLAALYSGSATTPNVAAAVLTYLRRQPVVAFAEGGIVRSLARPTEGPEPPSATGGLGA